MNNNNDNNTYDTLIQEYLCKHCGKPFVRGGKGRPKEFCSDWCRRTWGRKHAYRTKKLGRREASDGIYLKPVFRKEPDTKRLCRAIIAAALDAELDDEEEGAK